MPMLYTKCHCGTETREIVPIDTDGYITLKNGRKRFNPDAAKAVDNPIMQRSLKCKGCGKFNAVTDDPKAVNSFIQFNFMES
jgi:hypothetical protein